MTRDLGGREKVSGLDGAARRIGSHVNAPAQRDVLTGIVRAFLSEHDVELDMHVEEIRTADGKAFALIATTGRYIPLAEGLEPIDFTERDLFILERQDDGTWRGTHGAWNPEVEAG